MGYDFIEPWIFSSEDHLEKIVTLLQSLDYTGCIIENLKSDTINRVTANMKTETFFTIYSRKTIESGKRNPTEMDQFRQYFDFLTFFCTTPELTKWACQDQRIDSLLFSLKDIHKLIDDSTVNMALENSKSIEIEFTTVVQEKYPIPYLRNIKKSIFKITRKNLPVLLSSKANSFYDIKSPSSIIGFLNFLDVSDDYYETISQPWLKSRLSRNRSRKSDEFVSPGIRLSPEEKEN